jgi:hypothetical protein
VGLVQQKMGDLHGDGGQFDDLMGVVAHGGGQLPLATGTGRWIDVVHGGRLEQGYSRAWMALARPPFTYGGMPCGLGERRVR